MKRRYKLRICRWAATSDCSLAMPSDAPQRLAGQRERRRPHPPTPSKSGGASPEDRSDGDKKPSGQGFEHAAARRRHCLRKPEHGDRPLASASGAGQFYMIMQIFIGIVFSGMGTPLSARRYCRGRRGLGEKWLGVIGGAGGACVPRVPRQARDRSGPCAPQPGGSVKTCRRGSIAGWSPPGFILKRGIEDIS